MLQVTIQPILKLVRASTKNYVTGKEFAQLFDGLAAPPPKYAKILTQLQTRLGKFKKINKRDLLQITHEILVDAGAALETHHHRPMFDNHYWAKKNLIALYDQAFYGASRTVFTRNAHVHVKDGQAALFYFRCERNRHTGKLLIGNIQSAPHYRPALPQQTKNDIKRMMVHAAINHAHTLGLRTVTLQAGRGLILAQGWGKMPQKTIERCHVSMELPPPPKISTENYEHWFLHYLCKIEDLAHLGPHAKFIIGHQRYSLHAHTATTITILPERVYNNVSNLFHYFCHFAPNRNHIYELEKHYGPDTLDPIFRRQLNQITEAPDLNPDSYNHLLMLVKHRETQPLFDEINKLFSKLGFPSERLAENRDPKMEYLKNIDDLDNQLDFMGQNSHNFLKGYFEHYGYNKLLLEKFNWFTKSKITGAEYRVARRKFCYYDYSYKPPGITGIKIPIAKIPAPQLGKVYTTAWDFVDGMYNYPQKEVKLVENRTNARYVHYNFYEKEIPKFAKQLGYKVRPVNLTTDKINAKVTEGWEIDLAPGEFPLILY